MREKYGLLVMQDILEELHYDMIRKHGVMMQS